MWVSDYGYDETLHAFEKTATKLGVDQIDLLILHQPMPQHFDRTIQAYRALERLLADGRCEPSASATSCRTTSRRCASRPRSCPAINQVELHPYFTQPAVQRANAELGILTQAWSPIGGITFYPAGGRSRRSVIDDGRSVVSPPSRQVARAGHAAMAPTAGPVGDSQVD